MLTWRTAERATIEDARRNGNLLRVTWHEAEQRFAVSHWRDNVRIAATQVEVQDAAPMVGVLVDGPASAAGRPAPVAPPPRLVERLLERRRAQAA